MIWIKYIFISFWVWVRNFFFFEAIKKRLFGLNKIFVYSMLLNFTDFKIDQIKDNSKMNILFH